MADQACLGCGATSAGVFVCHFCGVPVHPLVDAESQRQALDELHGRLSADNPPPDLLKNAFLPDDSRVLIEAGLRLLPVLEDGVAQAPAAGRMRAVIIKLRLLGDDPALAKAAVEFQAALDSYQRSDRKMGIIVGAVMLAIAVVVLAKCVI